MFYILAIILFLISLGYTWYKFNHLRFAVQKAFQDLQEGLLKIINTSDGLWGEDFQNTLKEAIHAAVEETAAAGRNRRNRGEGGCRVRPRTGGAGASG